MACSGAAAAPAGRAFPLGQQHLLQQVQVLAQQALQHLLPALQPLARLLGVEAHVSALVGIAGHAECSPAHLGRAWERGGRHGKEGRCLGGLAGTG